MEKKLETNTRQVTLDTKLVETIQSYDVFLGEEESKIVSRLLDEDYKISSKLKKKIGLKVL